MPRKRESNIARSSSRAQTTRVARTQESVKQNRTLQIYGAARHAVQMAAETLGHSSVREFETFEHVEVRQALDADHHAAQRTAECLVQAQVCQSLNTEHRAAQRPAETLE